MHVIAARVGADIVDQPLDPGGMGVEGFIGRGVPASRRDSVSKIVSKLVSDGRAHELPPADVFDPGIYQGRPRSEIDICTESQPTRNRGYHDHEGTE